ncbi:MAG: heme lyase CcmF/NrfE family subunit [Myxococcota bacterium]
MNAILGQGCVLLGLVAATFGSVIGLTGGALQNVRMLRWTRVAVYVFAAAMVLANLVMIRALLQHDFSVSYVAQVGSRSTPTWVTVVSLWSSLEGSILFWGAILGLYLAAFTYFNRDRYREYMAYALGIMLVVGAFFALLIAGPAIPFVHLDPAPPDGPGPNPLLQNHILMVIHPPSLYLGYVGMTVPFGIACAALLRGRLSEGWLKPLRRWTMIPWTFLSIGIILGGWWAYEVLGWGGYWAWDPVENASFLPWLAATGYLHSTVVQERKRILKAWTLALVLTAFLLTLLGTFMTRSGVFNSVHSFTQSPIGPIFLGFLAVCTIGSLALLAGRSHLLEAEGRIEAVASRESAFLFNNLLFAVFTFTVLLGTVFPLITEAVRGVQVSVGEPYFDRMAIPIGLAMVFMMGVGPILPWGKPKLDVVLRSFVSPTIAGLVVAAASVALGIHAPMVVLTLSLCGFATVVSLEQIFGPVWERKRRRGESLGAAIQRVASGHRRRVGGHIVHLAVFLIVAAIAVSSAYKVSAEASLERGQSMELGRYTLTYDNTFVREYPHKRSVFARIEVRKGDKLVDVLEPRLNFYERQREPIGTPDVRSGFGSDLYLSLLSYRPDGTRVGLRAFKIPMVVWLWWAIPLIALGSVVSLWPKRRARKRLLDTSAATAPG